MNIITHCSLYANQMGFNHDVGAAVTDAMRSDQTFQSLLFEGHIGIGTEEDLLALKVFKEYKEDVRANVKKVSEKEIFFAGWYAHKILVPHIGRSEQGVCGIEKTKKLLEKLSQNSALYSVIQKDPEKVSQTIAFQKEVEECLEEIKAHALVVTAVAAKNEAIDMKYYIQNTEAGFLGNAILFWAKGRNGYTANLDNSEKFTEEDAKKICMGNPEKNKAWPVDYIDSNMGIQRIVDSQYLDHKNIKQF